MWCAIIDFGILKKQGRKGLSKFNGQTKPIQTEDAKMRVVMDLAAAVALQRLDGEPDESPGESTDDEHNDDEYENYFSEGE